MNHGVKTASTARGEALGGTQARKKYRRYLALGLPGRQPAVRARLEVAKGGPEVEPTPPAKKKKGEARGREALAGSIPHRQLVKSAEISMQAGERSTFCIFSSARTWF